MSDPYSDLLKQFETRRDNYLGRLISDEATFAEDPEKNGVARRRGYMKGQGPRPTCSLADQDLANAAAANNLVVWFDSPCVRAAIPEPWDHDDIQTVIPRLTRTTDPDQFRKSLVIPDPPAEDSTPPGFRGLMRLLRQLTVCGVADFRVRVRTLLQLTRDALFMAPDYQPVATFDAALVERIVISINDLPDPDAGDRANAEEMTQWLASRRVEGETAPISTAESVVNGIYALLGSTLSIDVITAAITNGHPGPYNAPVSDQEAPPDSRENPGNTYESPGSGYENPGTTGWEPPPNTYEDPSPKPPPPRGDVLLKPVWDTLNTLAFFGNLAKAQGALRGAILAMTGWLRGTAIVDQGRTLIQELFDIDPWWVPPVGSGKDGYPEFAWPPFTAEGIYWWRTVIRFECIEHCFALKDTADFKTTDLIRLVGLFPEPDDRIPDYVRIDVKLSLLWFKYWWDEPPAKDGKGNDIAEMTMWSENHQILFAQSQLLAGEMFRDSEFVRAGSKKGSDHIKEGIDRTERWLDRRLAFGFSEWNAPGYYNEDLPPLFNLVDFCNPDDPAVTDTDERAALGRIRTKAAMVLDLVVFDMARFTCRGSFGTTAGRAYWEHKCYGWEQSIGNMIEMLFGTRGDYVGSEGAAIALATSRYVVPEALLAIGLDRRYQDSQTPFTDRTRVSLDFDTAAQFNIGYESEEDVCFWWGLEAYYTDQTIDGTKKLVQAHDNLRLCDPFKPLYAVSDGWLKEALLDLASMAVDLVQLGAEAAFATAAGFLPMVILAAIDWNNFVDSITDFFKDLWDYLKSINKGGPLQGAAAGAAGGALVAGVPGAIVGGAAGFVIGLFGGDDNKPEIPDTALQALLEKLLKAFDTGTVLSTANIVTYNNGDAMLASVQNHLPGQVSFQKQPWMANLGCEACVWTTARMMAPDLGSYVTAWGEFFKDVGGLDFHSALADVAATPILQATDGSGDMFGHDGPNYWTGSLALPMIVQHENACIIAYDLPAMQRSLSGFATHAWFPKAMFDETHKQDINGGTWFFGRKDHTEDGVKTGSGYVALFSATPGDWTDEDGNAWNGKEIKTDAPGANVLKGSNIWICVVSSEAEYADAGAGKEYDTFCAEVANAYLHISGVGSPYQLECSFDIPRAKCPAGTTPRLELFYDDGKGRFAGTAIPLDGFPRFENRYVSMIVATPPQQAGLGPQVEGFSKSQSVGFGSTGYGFQHPSTGLTLEHDTTTPARTFTTQAEQQQASRRKRLSQDLSASRRVAPQPAPRRRALTAPRLDLSSIRRRTP